MSKSPPQQIGDVFFFTYTDKPPVCDLVYIWDIDKTYLNTNFDSLRGLLRTAFEKAFQKVNVPGSASLIRALVSPTHKESNKALFFISASPPQMEPKIYQKMRIDRIFPVGMALKDNLKNFRPRKFKRLRQQVGFKLQSLLELAVYLNRPSQFILFGDDSESDAVVYSLFSDICARRMPRAEVSSLLEALHVQPEQRRRILKLQELIPIYDPVQKIYINLVSDTDPDYYAKFGRRVLATFTTFQSALDLYQSQHLNFEELVMVGQDMLSNYGFTQEELAKNIEDLRKRGFISDDTFSKILGPLIENGILPSEYAPTYSPLKALQKLGEKLLPINKMDDPWVPDRIDYLNDFR
ncbi:MAG: hypothetical protein IT289_10880 [Oligoflexia bacterium]|nr:hypothetical protein [Oligoflexia bacterium]